MTVSAYDSPTHCVSLAACLARPGPKASNDLLSVLTTPGQAPHPVFALRCLPPCERFDALRLQYGSFRDHPVLQEPPQLNQQLPRQGHDAHLPRARPTAPEAHLIPAAQPAPGLVPQPAPRHLDGDRPDVPAPRLADPLLPARAPALVGRRDEARGRPPLPPVPEP